MKKRNDIDYSTMLQVREATLEDSKLIFNLSNDPFVRKNSINQEEIKWEKHLSWLKGKINDCNYIILLFFHKELLVGQVKFEIINEIAFISISITSNFRGKGLAKTLLKESVEKIKTHNNNIKKLIALIKPENKASIISFKKLGFVFIEEEAIKKVNYNKYKLDI